MKTLIFSGLMMAAAIIAHAQPATTQIANALAAIELHNTALQAMRAGDEADRLATRTGIFLEGPEVEYSRLWGSPTTIGNRTDVSVTQSLDLLTLTGRRSNVARQRSRLIDARFATNRQALLLEAELQCIDMIYGNARRRQLVCRQAQMEELLAATEHKFAAGEGTALEVDNVKLELSAIGAEIATVDADLQAIGETLQQLNGGEPITLSSNELPLPQLPDSFEQWCETTADQSPLIAQAQSLIALSQSEEALSKASWLPTVSAGYMSEKTVGEHFQGITVVMQIPLWSNRNRIKQAKAAVTAAQLQADDSRTQLVASLRAQYQRAQGLQRSVNIYDQALAENQGPELLRKSLDHGQISMPEYLTALDRYYLAATNALTARRDYLVAHATLTSPLL